MLSQISNMLDKPEFLSYEEIDKLVLEYQNGNSIVGQKLVESFIPLINKTCMEYVNGYTLSISKDDLFQEAIIGFYKALSSFDSDKGNLSIYAIPYIRRTIMDYILDNKKMIRTITSKDMRKMYFNRFKYTDANGTLDIRAMSENEDIPIHRVREFNERMNFNSLYNDLVDDGGDWDLYINRIECQWSDITTYEENEEYSMQRNAIHKALGTLNEKEYDVINRVYLAKEPESMSAIAREYSVSPQRIQQIERNAVKKIKAKV